MDAGGSDAGRADAGGVDAGEQPDAGSSDLGVQDLGFDAGQADQGQQDAGPSDAGAMDMGAPDAGGPSGCQVSVCMAGAFTREDAANPTFESICSMLPGIVEDCSGGQCYFMYAFSARDAALEGLISALDTNNDAQVDMLDDDCEVNLLGYSWGGVNTTLMAEAFLSDPRVAPSRAVIDRMVALDPFSPLAGDTVEIVAGVQRYWSYRHTSSPSNDCSSGAPLGPYRGLPPLCDSSAQCTDYDYSLTPGASFMGFGGTYSGAQIGHCTIVDASGPAIVHNLTTGTDFPGAPTSVPVGGL